MSTPIIFAISAFLTFLLTYAILRKLIPMLASRKMGQPILDIGPRWHKSKEGTPTMGGLSFIVSSAVVGIASVVLLWVRDGMEAAMPLMLTLIMAVLNGLIGIVDDSAKLKKKQNEGLTAAQKFILQVLVAGLYLLGMCYFCDITTKLYIPFVNVTLDFGVFFYIIAMLLLCGVVNSVNLTDGIDGLASSITLVVAVFYSLSAFFAFDKVNSALSLLGSIMIGATIGFLMYNFYPARVFMGDTGSLFLGGLVVGGAFMMNNPLIVVVCGLMFIVETASVMLQVTYFKLTHGKRLFKMAPIHHHFEKCGWKETKIVVVFSIITVIFSAIAWFGLN